MKTYSKNETIFNGGTAFFYTCYMGEKLLQVFKCKNCGFNKCYRPKSMYGLSFLEGSFRCQNCKKEVWYCSGDFERTPIVPAQLKLEL